MTRIAHFIVTHHKRIIAVTVLITIVALLMLFRMAFGMISKRN